MKSTLLTFLVCFAFCICGKCTEPSYASDAALLAHWMVSQQCTESNLPSYGGVKLGSGVAAIGTDGKPYYCITPYFSNLGVLGLVRARMPECVHVADLWINWYFAHLNLQSAPAGVPCDHFCRMDGGGETNCIKPGDPLLCRHNDATDSAAATFFSVLWAAHQAGLPTTILATPERKQRIETLAGVLLKLQQADGLCWAKSDYRVKYLEDNSEVFAGLSDLASLEREVFNDAGHCILYRKAAGRVRQGIFRELYDRRASHFLVAKFEDGKRPAANLDKWYPDTQAQLWPLLFGVARSNDPTTQATIDLVNSHWNGHLRPDWVSHPELINQGWIEAGDACAMLMGGETQRVRSFVRAVIHLKFQKPAEFKGPFTVADAGWLLQILTELPDSPMENSK